MTLLEKGKKQHGFMQRFRNALLLINSKSKHLRIVLVLCVTMLFIVLMRQIKLEIDAWNFDAQLPSPTNATTHWCTLDKAGTGKMFRSSVHFPFAHEWVAGCWSWMEQNNKTTKEIAIALDNIIYKRFISQPNYPTWNHHYFRGLDIPVISGEPPIGTPQDQIFTKPFGGDKWFNNEHSCFTMREKLWSSLGLSAEKKRRDKVRIGIIERPARRLIVNSAELAKALQLEYSDKAIVNYKVFSDDDSLVDQSKWYYEQDILLTAHGAGMTNIIFMRPDTYIVEMFPNSFFHEMYTPLAKQCGVHHSYYYDGGDNPRQDYKNHYDQRGKLRNKNIKITFQQMKNIVDDLMIKWSSTAQQ